MNGKEGFSIITDSFLGKKTRKEQKSGEIYQSDETVIFSVLMETSSELSIKLKYTI